MLQESSNRDAANRAIAAVVPHRADDLARLDVLASADQRPVVTVVGKYNHGKSSLLNALSGSSGFAVADRRETTRLAEHATAEIRWLDAPGLDADVAGDDDRHALDAAWKAADVRLLVHAAREGELDAAEQALLAQLSADAEHTGRQVLFVLTQIDQVDSEDTLARVSATLQTQAGRLPLHPASASRHQRGLADGKPLLVARSGIPALQQRLRAACQQVPDARRHETALRLRELHTDIEREAGHRREQAEAIASRQTGERQQFLAGLDAVFDQARTDIQQMLDACPAGEDLALRPDSHADRFRQTAAKAERTRQQLAYAKVCLSLRAYLAGHGVEHLPPTPDCQSHSLNTVMVAVLGVATKYARDLRQMFCEPRGRENLQRSFIHYYELSDDRVALARAGEQARTAYDASQHALTQFDVLAAGA